MKMRDKIIEYIKCNRVSTTEVADCLGKTGVIPDVMPIRSGYFQVGKVKWVYAFDESNWSVHEQITNTEKEDIVLIDTFGCNGRAVIGELVSKYILLYRQASAIVALAPMRDAAALLKENYPIWCKGFNPVWWFNKKSNNFPQGDILKEHKEKYDGAIAVCDDCGVVLIPKEFHDENFYQKLEAIEEQEDIWFERLDRFKENTFEIVCLKKYLEKKY